KQPSRSPRRSLARDCHRHDALRFPRVRLNSRRGFPTLVLKHLKSDASADSATPANRCQCSAHLETGQDDCAGVQCAYSKPLAFALVRFGKRETASPHLEIAYAT